MKLAEVSWRFLSMANLLGECRIMSWDYRTMWSCIFFECALTQKISLQFTLLMSFDNTRYALCQDILQKFMIRTRNSTHCSLFDLINRLKHRPLIIFFRKDITPKSFSHSINCHKYSKGDHMLFTFPVLTGGPWSRTSRIGYAVGRLNTCGGGYEQIYKV